MKKAWQHGAAHLAAFLTFFMQFSGRMFHVFKVGHGCDDDDNGDDDDDDDDTKDEMK